MPKCPSCSSSNIQMRDMAIAGGKSSTIGLGVSSNGGMAVGIGRSRTDLSKKASFEGQNDVGFESVIPSVFVGLIFGAIGWVIGIVFDGIFRTEFLAYFILVPLCIGCFGMLVILSMSQVMSAKDDKTKGWICLSCGSKFEKPNR